VVGGAEAHACGLFAGDCDAGCGPSSPHPGKPCDFTAAKKRILFVFFCISWIFTALPLFCRAGQYFYRHVVLSSWQSRLPRRQVFYNALCRISPHPKKWDVFSGNGWQSARWEASFGHVFHPPVIGADRQQSAGSAWIVRFTAAFFRALHVRCSCVSKNATWESPAPQGKTISAWPSNA